MMDADLKRNASGYYDDTCYKGITAPPKADEIWLNKKGQYVLVINSNAKVASNLLLTASNTAEEHMIPVSAGGKVLYTEPLMIGYALVRCFDAFVMKAKPEEFAVVREELGKALGINTFQARNAELLEERDRLLLENGELRKEKENIMFDLHAKTMADKMVNDSIADMEDEIHKLKIYKELYTELIDKLVSVRGGYRQ